MPADMMPMWLLLMELLKVCQEWKAWKTVSYLQPGRKWEGGGAPKEKEGGADSWKEVYLENRQVEAIFGLTRRLAIESWK